MNKGILVAVLPLFAWTSVSGVPGDSPIADQLQPAVVTAPQGQGQEPVAPQFVCPKKKSKVLSGGGTTTGVTTTCGDGNGCGYILTYNPPTTECEASELEVCCVEQIQQGYTQVFSCQPGVHSGDPTRCVGGAKSPFGSNHVVCVTVACETAGCATPPSEY